MTSSHQLIKSLPSDVRLALYWRQLKRVGFFVFWYLALTYGIWRYASSARMASAPVSNIIALAAVFGIIPFFIFNFGKIFTECTYEGVITEVLTVGSWGRGIVTRSTKASNASYARITIDDGRHKHRVFLENTDGRWNEYFKAGDRVRHFRYIEIPQSISETPSHPDAVVCVLCGEEYSVGDEKCTKCGHTLLKR